MSDDGGKDTDDLWKGAHEVKLPSGNAILQVQGIGSPTRTVFARICAPVSEESSVVVDASSYTVQQILHIILQEIQPETNAIPNNLDAEELLGLGSIWRLSKTAHHQSKWKRTRLFQQNAMDQVSYYCGASSANTRKHNKGAEESLRVHYCPSRFPAVAFVDWTLPLMQHTTIQSAAQTQPPTAIQHYDPEFGFCVVHKPSGLPSHATVDNGVENVLYSIQQQQQQFQRQHNNKKCSLPQRLDIDTEGLLVVAMRSEFASFMGRLLQDKTLLQNSNNDNNDGNRTTSGIHKQYKCLLRVPNTKARESLIQQYYRHNDSKQSLVIHYTDPKSAAPKPFVLEPRIGWQQCALRIIEVGPIGTLQGSCNKHNNNTQEEEKVMEVTVELLTGRTHQIRGQFAALNLPLVGDLLYYCNNMNGKPQQPQSGDSTWDKVRNRGVQDAQDYSPHPPVVLALQCCSLSFPKPKWDSTPRGRRVLVPDDSKEVCSFALDRAWWSDLVG
ncbi:RNA pseudouridine synthase 6, chloroplastic [Seminavis robusta]|uniref:RNA pseudouridine synthase 6, chloroplastic n=1 Tax=Seminavis robusta TaxID=568900 RepID=A0A9N8DVL2_9STRA|nr:RNA pseudouridine synthase 6, chloroplastic [Seminavis robusta]|eukprot:Sro405_g136210.1 RNA pseudouridine synthase 6, chloroplastic (498) ;mRNA; r:52804-54297